MLALDQKVSQKTAYLDTGMGRVGTGVQLPNKIAIAPSMTAKPVNLRYFDMEIVRRRGFRPLFPGAR